MILHNHNQKSRFQSIVRALSLIFPLFVIVVSLAIVSCGDDDEEQEDNPSKIDEISYLQCPDDNHPHLIDLGLPSDTKWACCNVGAKKPEELGDRYAWGETSVKKQYNLENYAFFDTSSDTYKGIVKIIGTQYDAAHVNWGEAWQMPSKAQMEELVNQCDFETTVHGIQVTGPNGGTILLYYPSSKEAGYWTGSIAYSYPLDQSVWFLKVERDGTPAIYNGNCYYGRPIRPVSNSSSSGNTSLSKKQKEIVAKLVGKWILVRYEFVGEVSETYDENDDHYVEFYDDFTAYVQPRDLFEAEKNHCYWTLNGTSKIVFNDDEDDTYSIIQLTSSSLILGWLNDGKVVEKTTFTKAK